MTASVAVSVLPPTARAESPGVNLDGTCNGKVYRKLSVKYHPDKNPDEESKRRFAEVRDAYEAKGPLAREGGRC